MTEYNFQTKEFGVTNNGIHLLRSGYNYQSIEFSQIENLTIEKGRELNNWFAILILGLGLIAISIYYSLKLFTIIQNNEVSVIYIEEIVVPVIPLMLGGYCLYSSTRSATVARVRTMSNETRKISLKEFEKENRIEAFQIFIKERLNGKVEVNM